MTAPGGGEDRPVARALEAARSGALYGAGIPERALRAMVGTASGLLRESARAAVPDAMKGTKLYDLTVQKMLRFLVEDVGGLEGTGGAAAQGLPAPRENGPPTEEAAEGAAAGNDTSPGGSEYVIKKALGNAIDIAGLASLHLSPLWIIAVFSDVVLGVRTYLDALGEELRRTGVIGKDTRFEGADGLLCAIQKMSGAVADGLDTPPVTAAELRKMVDTLRTESKKMDLRGLLPPEEMDRLWSGIHEAARIEGRSPFEISSALAMMVYGQIVRAGRGATGTVKVGLDLLQDNVVNYYLGSLAELRAKGLYQAVADASAPYLEGLRHLFEPSQETFTEKILKGKPLRALWRMLKRWFGRGA